MKLCALLFTALAAAAVGPAHALTAPMLLGVPDQDHGLRGTARYDRGIYTAFCPRRAPRALTASTSHAGWPAKECLKMDKGPEGRRHTIVGLNGVHNWLLGGYGDDTIIGGVIHCQSPGILVYLSRTSQRHFKLDGCRRISHFSVGY